MAAVSYLEATEEAVTLSPQEAASLQRAMATTGFAEDYDKGHGGDGFRETAMNYESRAEKYNEKGFLNFELL